MMMMISATEFARRPWRFVRRLLPAVAATVLLACGGGESGGGGSALLGEFEVEQSLLKYHQRHAPLRGSFRDAPRISCVTNDWTAIHSGVERAYKAITKVDVVVSDVHPLLSHVETFLLMSPTPDLDFDVTPVWAAPLDVETEITCIDGAVDKSTAAIVTGAMVFPARGVTMDEDVFDEAAARVEEHGLESLRDDDISNGF